MKSVEALRKWADGLRGIWIDPNDHTIIATTCDDMPPSIDCVNLREHVNAILDEIEREVEELRDRDYRNGREDAKGAVEFADRLKAAVDKREDVTLWGVDYTPLPVDADGVPIHVGDVMENIVCPPVHREVTGVGVECFYGWDDGNGRYSQFDVACYRHHHAPTVEDVLREFASDIADVLGGDDFRLDDSDELFAEYAAKLRLAGEDE